jgi:hypothetical protein
LTNDLRLGNILDCSRLRIAWRLAHEDGRAAFIDIARISGYRRWLHTVDRHNGCHDGVYRVQRERSGQQASRCRRHLLHGLPAGWGVTGNPSYSYLALYDEDRPVFGMAAGNGIPANTHLYDGVRLSGQRYGTVGNLQSGELISFQVSPATITANSRRVTAVASLFTNFMGIPGCAVTLKVSVVR